jgi:iron complex transport system ATP-binding protein
VNLPPLIEFHNVSVARGGRVALDGVSLSIAAGEHAAILGPNGSGKSTFIKAITRECYPLLRGPDSYVRIFGRQVWNVFELRSLLGIVTSDLERACSREFTAREIIVSGFFSSVGVWPYYQVTPAMEERTAAVLDLLEIPHLAGRPVGEMSSGETRRVMIARALVHNPRALVLDEPTTSLDLRAARGLRDTLRKIAASGVSLIVVTHHLPDILPEVQRVICLRDGRVVRDGDKEQVLTPDVLECVFGIPVEVVRQDGYYLAW